MAALGSHPRLLPELLRMVIKELGEFKSPEDLVWLWFGARHVSRHLKHEIEEIFRKTHLPGTVLYCNLGMSSIRIEALEAVPTTC